MFEASRPHRLAELAAWQDIGPKEKKMRQREGDASESIDWRGRFISLAEDVRSARGQSAAAIVDDPDTYLSMTVPSDGIVFEFLHFPDANERLVVHCRLGPVPEARGAGMLKKALAMSMPLALTHTGMFALDPDTGDLVYSTAESLRGLAADQLLDNMSAMAAAVQPWMQPSQQSA
jgi:hypothetical protein